MIFHHLKSFFKDSDRPDLFELLWSVVSAVLEQTKGRVASTMDFWKVPFLIKYRYRYLKFVNIQLA